MINIVQYAILSEKLPEKSPFLLYIFRPVNFWHGYYATGNRDNFLGNSHHGIYFIYS